MISVGPSARRGAADGAPGGRVSLRPGQPALAAVVALAAAVVGSVAVSGGSSALLVVRAVVLLLLALSVAAVLGILAVVVVSLPADDRRRSRLLDVAAGAAALWTVLAATTAFLLYLGEAPPVASAAFGPGLVSFVADIAIGRTWLIATVAAAVLTTLLVAVRSRAGVALLWVATAAAAVPIALQTATPGGSIGAERAVVSAALVQLLAFGTWIGALGTAGAIGAPVRRRAPLWCAAAMVVAEGAAWAALRADGALSPVAVLGGAAVGLAAVPAVLAGVTRVPGLHGLQLVLLALGSGLAAAAWVTHTVPAVPDRTSPAELLTGAPLPPAPTVATVLGGWQPDPLWLVLCGALLAGYGATALRRRGWPLVRSSSWIAGVVLLAWLTNGGPAVYQDLLLGAHLLQHLALLLVVPVLLAGGAPGRLMAASGGSLAQAVGAALDGGARALVRPAPAAIVWVAAVLALYGSSALRWSVGDVVGTEVATAGCLLVGVLLVGALTTREASRRAAVVIAIVLLVAESAGALVLAVSPSLLAADWFGAMGWGTDALAAQRGSAPGAWAVAAAPTLALLVHGLRRPRAVRTGFVRSEAVVA